MTAPEAPGLASNYPSICVRGTPYERGVQYGNLARRQIHGSLKLYEHVFRQLLDVDWRWVRERARSFSESIADFDNAIVQEMRGLADGAQLEYDDILALNCRTEVIDAASVSAAAGHGGLFIPECSTFAAEASATAGGRLLIGQNWDWLVGCERNVIVLHVEQDAKPNYVTVVEAGLLAKMGMNDVGVALTTNGLVSEQDAGGDGLPFHVMLRALIEARTLSDGVTTLQRTTRASSGNYLLASGSGLAVNIETVSGDYHGATVALPVDGVFAHTNHFTCRSGPGLSVAVWESPASPLRLHRLSTFLQESSGQLDRAGLEGILADHADHPWGLCTHENVDLPEHERYATRASIIMEPETRTMWLAEGNPCVAPFRELDTSILGGT
jgi:isopenicillin-N N-acyltransferase like protein